MSARSRVTDPGLDDALIRAIRRLIADAIETGQSADAGTEAGTGAKTDGAGSAAA